MLLGAHGAYSGGSGCCGITALITVAADNMPGSTERPVTIVGMPSSIHRAVYDICLKLMEV